MKKNIKMLAFACLFVALLGSASAVTILTFGDSRSIGLINDGIPSDPTDTATYVNNLMTVPLSTGPVTIGTESYTRTGNDFGTLPPASGSPGQFLKQNNSNNTFDLGLGGFTYLVGKWDAGNAGSYAWFTGGLTGLVEIPQNFTFNQYGLSHTTAFGPGAQNVPDGGSTIALMGTSLLVLAILSRRFGFLPV